LPKILPYCCFLLLCLEYSCKDRTIPKDTLFLKRGNTGIDFSNTLTYSEALNPYTFKSFFNGGGVGLGDFNNDGLLDIFFSGNQVSNKLYLNKGSFQFEDITNKAGLETKDVWCTGVAVVDINADGFLDLYICKSGPPGGTRRANELFVNQGDLTFKESAKQYNLDFTGLSVHSAFFDYDKDGDLDCYLLNNSIRSIGGYDLIKDQRTIPDPNGGNKLLRNDDGKFVDVTIEAGIFCSKIGFGLGVTVGDIDKDGWQDMFVSNDFFERDYLYLNNHDGTFKEALESCVREISMGSMGADMADINNDGLPEIFVTEMLPEHDERLKTTSQFETWDKHKISVDQGYFQQFSRNVLQLNNGDGTFSEISRYAGVQATDWSWGALIFDMDNDGFKDIFVGNGIYKDLINQDYVNFIADPDLVRDILRKEKNVVKRLIDSIPSNKIANYAFHNKGNLTFTNQTTNWGLDEPSFSNGSAYGDLDNDGDVDLVINNVNMPAFVYENKSKQQSIKQNTISLKLKGEGKNTFALGTKVSLYTGTEMIYQEVSPMRGFMSSVDSRLHFGLGSKTIVDSIRITWPNDKATILKNLAVNQLLRVWQKDAPESGEIPIKTAFKPIFSSANIKGVDFKHQEGDFSDFDADRLLFNMISNEGPCLCSGDINADGLEDFYVGGAKGQAGAIYVQTAQATFIKTVQPILDKDRDSEDTDCIFFDANGDQKQDLYVASGGNEFSSSSSALLDRLYFNKGNGRFVKSEQILNSFESTSTVSAADYDKDGDLDLFIGSRVVPGFYGIPASGFILENDGQGNFTDVTSSVAPCLSKIGLITTSKWIDVDNDKFPDLLVAGEWMPLKLFINERGRLIDKSEKFGLKDTEGWYHSLSVGDFNNDGLQDFFAGNHGLNSRFKASLKEPVELHINDFDQNGTIDHVTTYFDLGRRYPLNLRQDIVSQMPSLKKKFLHFHDYQGKSIEEVFTPEQRKRSIVLKANTFESAIWLNTGKQSFEKKPLPLQMQFSPVYSSLVQDFDKDGAIDILAGGNLYRAKPETGIYDASYGLFLKGDGKGGFEALPSQKSGVFVTGEIRGLRSIPLKGKHLVIIGKNNDRVEFLEY
jgi:enediyne biosynthesis protein E4